MGGRELCRADMMKGEGALRLHLLWNEEQGEGCVKDTKGGQMCVFIFAYVCVCVSACECA